MKQILIIFGIFAIFMASNDAVVFKLTNFNCQSYNKSWFIIHTCRLKVIGRERIAAYFNGSFLHPAKVIGVDGEVLKKANGYKPWIVKAKVDICRFLKKPYDPATMMIANLFLDFTNFNHTCPYIGPAIIDGFYLRPEKLKIPLPTGDYKLTLAWYFDKKLQFQTNASFTFAENLLDQ